MKEFLMEQKAYYTQQGKKELDFACDFLHANADNWSSSSEEIFREHVGLAMANMNKALAIEETLKKSEAQND